MDAKVIYAVINALGKRLFFQEAQFTNEFIRNELQIQDDTVAEFNIVAARLEDTLKAAAYHDFGVNELEKQLQKKETPEAEAQALLKYWKLQKAKIHESLVSSSSWNGRLEALNWRIDVKTKSKDFNELNEPTAIVEMKLSKQVPQSSNTVRFEVDKTGVAHILEQIACIEKHLSVASKEP
eukprot:Colp12_sorted_trinity150504_noHs@35888